MTTRWTVATCCMLSIVPPALLRAGDAERFFDAPLVGVEAGLGFAEGFAVPWPGVRLSRLRPAGLGLEAGLSGTILDLDVVFASPRGDGVSFLVRAGGSAFVAVGEGAAAYPGLNLGGALLFQKSARTAVRLDYTLRRFSDEYENVVFHCLSVGLVLRL